MRWIFVIVCTFLIEFIGLFNPIDHECLASDFVIYSVYRGLNLGNTNEAPAKDYYINMGSGEGLHIGSVLEVYRRLSTYDLLSEQLYTDVIFPIATVKIIHVEPRASIARLEKMKPQDSTPEINPKSVMVGDIVRLPQVP